MQRFRMKSRLEGKPAAWVENRTWANHGMSKGILFFRHIVFLDELMTTPIRAHSIRKTNYKKK
jgi:hypothetical protein